MPDLRSLTSRFVHDGLVEAIYLRPARGVAAVAVDNADAIAGRGLLGDRTADRTPTVANGGKRQVTLIQAEHLPLIARWAGGSGTEATIDAALDAALDAAALRRNLVISGFNLLSARSPFADQVFRVAIGNAVVLVVTGDCAPCSKMEDLLGRGGYNALRGHGGVTARVEQGGRIAVGDRVRVVGVA